MKDLIKIAGFCFLIGGPFLCRSDLNYRVSKVADINKDNVTDISEWKKVYSKLGIHFDELNPKKLGIFDCTKYLLKNKREIKGGKK